MGNIRRKVMQIRIVQESPFRNSRQMAIGISVESVNRPNV